MKLRTFYLIALTLLTFGQSYSQKTLLPFGQFSKQPWTATCYSAPKNGTQPAENWYAKDFDDSSWTEISGPLATPGSSSISSLPYSNYVWNKELEFGTYWTRRHFTVDDINNIWDIYFYATHDDACVAYLNGTLIYDRDGVITYPNYSIVNFNNNVRNLIEEGDNVLAVMVSDTGGIVAFMDYGLYSYSLINGTFSNSDGWTGDFDRHKRYSNSVAYRYGNNASCNQTIADASTGLYKLTANACGMEYYNNQNTATAHKTDIIPTALYINDTELNIPSAFSESSATDYGHSWNIESKYVTYDPTYTPRLFDEGMYKCEIWNFYDADKSDDLNVGIRSKATDNIDRWTAWDNMDITYYSEPEVSELLTSEISIYSELNSKPQNSQIKSQSLVLLSNADKAQSYKEKGLSCAALKNHEHAVRGSIEIYESMIEPLHELHDSIENASEFTSPATLEEAKQLYDSALAAYSNGDYEDNDISSVIAKINTLLKRLGYVYLDIKIENPGALGDSILSKVENFVDLKSLKISGTLNDADKNILKNNLSHLRELDITDVNMTSIPDKLFYERPALELIKLPSVLNTIGEYAFYRCKALDNLEFPNNLTTIKAYAFAGCDNLKMISLNEGLSSLGERAFDNCDNIRYLKIPSTLTTIGNYAFYKNVNLEKIDFSDGLKDIYHGAFQYCYKLNNLVFPNSLYYIGGDAFYQNLSLNNIVFNEGLYQIDDNAFYDCDALTELTLPSSLVLASTPFDYCDNLKKVSCLSIDPPYLNAQMPYGVDMAGRELYVPEFSINTYKQHPEWSKFPTIKPIQSLPENIYVHSDLHLTLNDAVPANYKPNVTLIHDNEGSSYLNYGALTINGSCNLTISNFETLIDPNYQYDQPDRTRNNCSLVNNINISADNVAVRGFIPNNRWTFLSFPFNVKVSEIESIENGSTNWIIRRYDGGKRAAGESNQTWVKMNKDDILNAGEGYIIQSSRYIGTSYQYHSGFLFKAVNDASKNNIFNSDDVSVALKEYASEFSHSRSWNLIGNPYPCYYDTRFMDFTAPITVWNMRNNTYTAYSPVDDKYILCPGEAFFVQRPLDNGSIVFSKEGRQTDRTARTIETPTLVYSPNVADRIIANISISDGIYTDRTRIVLNENALMDYEMDKDASKFKSSDLSIAQIFTSANGIDYSINERPVSDGTVDLDLHIGQDGSYTISLLENLCDYKVYIEDKEQSVKTELSEGQDFTFVAKAGEIHGRFVLHFTNGTTNVNSIEDNQQSDNTIYSIDGVKVKAPIRNGIYIKNGKKIVVNN